MRIRIFAIGIALIAYMGFASCDDDRIDEPADGTEQQDPDRSFRQPSPSH